MGEARRALIIANTVYSGGLKGLNSPIRDAEEFARVLRNPQIGGFEVETVINQTASVINHAIEEFFIFSKPKLDDLLLLYFSGHGITDSERRLFLCAADTKLENLRIRKATAVDSAFVDSTMRESRSRRQILILDCRHSGAFSERGYSKGDALPPIQGYFTSPSGEGPNSSNLIKRKSAFFRTPIRFKPARAFFLYSKCSARSGDW